MSHQCVHCGAIYPNASKELLEGCSKCKSRFFFFIRDDRLQSIKEKQEASFLLELKNEEKAQIERDVREIMDMEDEESPVILDLESIRVLGPGKFEIDVVNLFNKSRPIVYKLEEGKYVIDLKSGLDDAKYKKF
ncbi:MAG TPA: Zn-ribbon containing protein [Candidatus Nanoarchaeia archaeon]|nr:Zn-ribbon containing protein [Candidatus Nanoarchaeia archaeon]